MKVKGKRRLIFLFVYCSFLVSGPPGPPKNPHTKSVKASSATLVWNKPDDSGSYSGGVYVIECTNCPVERTEFPLNTTNLQIVCNGLGAYVEYQLSITKHNNITELTGKQNSVEYKFTTKAGGK